MELMSWFTLEPCHLILLHLPQFMLHQPLHILYLLLLLLMKLLPPHILLLLLLMNRLLQLILHQNKNMEPPVMKPQLLLQLM